MRSISPSLTLATFVLIATALMLQQSCENCAQVSAFVLPDAKVNTFSDGMVKARITAFTLMSATSDVVATSDAPVKSANTQKKKKVKKNNNQKTRNKNKSKKKRSSPSKFKEGLPLTSLTLGSKISGVVAGISPFGAFIKTSYKLKSGSDNGYALLHISQIQDTLVDDVSSVLQVGQRLNNLRVISINYAKGEVNLSLRSPRPKRKELSELNVGDMIYGKVRNITPYGAFVDVGCKINLLLHKSRISKLKVENIADFIQVGEKINVRVISIDEKKKNLAGSMLDLNTDLYLNKRKKIAEKKGRKSESPAVVSDEVSEKADAEIFDDAMRDLNGIFEIEE